MLFPRPLIAALASVSLVACSGGGAPPSGSSGGTAGSGGSGGTTTPPTSSTDCSLRARQLWAAQQLNEWYLFPETLPQSLDPAPYASVQDYLDALTATARSQGKDRFFTYVDSIAEENAFFNSGQTAAFGIRLKTDTAARRLFVADAYEGAPAILAGFDRGTEILAIGTSPSNLVPVADLIARGGSALNDAFGPSSAGTSRSFRIVEGQGERVVTATKADFNIPPISSRYGVQVLTDGGRRVGYVNLRTFISTADPALRQAFSTFRAQGIREVIIDFRYNGGGLVDIAELMGDLMGEGRLSGDVYSTTNYRPSKAQFDETRRFQRQPESIAPLKLAFIATGDTASASELVINSMEPWARGEVTLVGANSFGKPVGQIARDRSACDDRLRVVAFATRNADGRGDYYNGLASTVGRTCAAADEVSRPMGDPDEPSTRAALDALAGRSCSPISALSRAQSLDSRGGRTALLVPARPDVVQREVPGTY
jgi:C-terminal processing protease CtpA/Prc